MTRPKISAFMITYNAAAKIEKALRSIAWADEIIVIDSHSQDRTVAIAQSYHARVIHRVFTDYSDQRNFALSCASHAWVFWLDADEEVTEELQHEIQNTLANPAHAAYQIPRCSYLWGRRFRFSGTQHDKPIRLFQKTAGVFEQPIHEKVRIQGTIGCLRHFINHYTYDTIPDYFERFNRYTTMEAQYLRDQNRTISFLDLLLRPPTFFVRQYFWQQGFRDGWEGFLFALFSSWYVFVKYAKSKGLLKNHHVS